MKYSWLLLVLALPLISYAKCASLEYNVSGRVVGSSGKPLAGAAVGVAWRSYNDSLQGPAIAISDSSGRYKIRFNVSAYSGSSFFQSDVCNFKVSELTIAASHAGQKSWPLRLKTSGQKILVRELEVAFPLEMPWL